MFRFRRRLNDVEKRLASYAAAPSPGQALMPAEVQAIFDGARRRAATDPARANSIARDVWNQVPATDRERLTRLVFYTAATAQGMAAQEAVFYSGRMWRQLAAELGDSGPTPAAA